MAVQGGWMRGMARLAVGLVVAATAGAGLVPVAAGQPAKPVPAPPPAHPEADYMGSTLARHEPEAAARSVGAMAVAPWGTPGIDVSHWQGRMDWNAVAAGGTKFAFMKATEGVTYQDPEFSNNYNGSLAAGLIRGAYHFALPDVSSGAVQADYFHARGGGWSGEGATLPGVLDIEYNPYGPTCYGLSPSQMVAWIEDFVTTMHARTGRWPIIYTTRGWWRSCTGNNPSFALRTPLWIAGYNGEPVNLPFGWPSHALWQYASSPIDQDVFNGTVDELRALATGSEAGAIDAHYAALGGAGYLGAPAGPRYAVGGGSAQDYTDGTIYFTPGTGAWSLRGDMLAFYRQRGGPAGVLGFPGYDDSPAPDGVGRRSHFQVGSVYWSPASGAHSVHGAIRTTYAGLGWEGLLGYPTSDEQGTPDGIGSFNSFQRGVIYWSSGTGAHEVYGSILGTWTALGLERSYLGYPTTGELGAADGIGRANFFQRGAIYWTNATGAHEVQGAIYNTWAGLGWQASYLGYPTTGELSTADGVGRANFFQRGAIYWTDATGAHEVQGSIYDRWAALGWQTSYLGYPVTGELGTADGVGRASFFQRGAIYWTSATGAHEVQGAIYNTWASLGYQNSALGYPTSGEFTVSGGKRSNFQHGHITWIAATGQTQVTYL